MPVVEAQDRVLHAEPEEKDGLAVVLNLLDRLESAGDLKAKLVGPDGRAIEIPPSAYEALRAVVGGMARGLTMTLVPHGKELTTQEAADLLNISRTYLVKLVDNGQIPAHMVGTHRRLKIEDVLQYRAQRADVRREALAEITAIGEEFGYE